MEPKKEIAPLDRLQHIFNDVLDDLTFTTKNAWKHKGPEKKKTLQIALDAKLEVYRNMYTEAMEAAANDSVKALFHNMESAPPAFDPCEYCDGQGYSTVEVGGMEHELPCIACDGSGQVERKATK